MAIQKLSGENDMESLKKMAPGHESTRHASAIALCYPAILAPPPDLGAVLSFWLEVAVGLFWQPH